MSKNTTGKWLLLGIAFIVSCLIWYMVITNDDPRINISLGNIEVELLNEEQLHRQGLAYYVEEGASIEVTVNVLQEKGWFIKTDDIHLTADLSGWNSGKNMIPIKAEVVGNQSIIGNSYKLDSNVLKIRTEKLVKKEIPVTILTEGEPEDDCSIGIPVSEKDTVEIQIPESICDKVVTAEATVDVSGRSADYEGEVTLSFLDDEKKPVDCEENQIFPDIKKVAVTIPIGIKKKIDIDTISGMGTCKEGYRCTGIKADRSSLWVIGGQDEVESLEKITIPAYKVNLTNKSSSFEEKFKLQEYLPHNVRIYDPEDAVLMVFVQIEKLERKTFSLSSEDITVKNCPSAFKAQVAKTQITVVVEALAGELDQLDEEKIHMSVDLSGYREGTHRIEIAYSFDVSDQTKYKVISSEKATIHLSGS